MIFAKGDHIQQVIDGTKTQTRRSSDRYQVGNTYAIQPCRTCKGIPDGRIKILDKVVEVWPTTISPDDAKAEGGYTPEEFENLYANLHPRWCVRIAYTFRFVPQENA